MMVGPDLARIWRAQPLPPILQPHTALLVIDGDQLGAIDHIPPSYGLDVEEDRIAFAVRCDAAVDVLQKIVVACRSAGIMIVDSRSSDGRQDADIRVMGDVSPDLRLVRSGASFFASELGDQILRNVGIDTLFVAGLHSDGAVASTVRDAADRGYRTVVIADACVATSEDLHDHSLSMLRLWYAHISVSVDLLAALAVAKPSAA